MAHCVSIRMGYPAAVLLSALFALGAVVGSSAFADVPVLDLGPKATRISQEAAEAKTGAAIPAADGAKPGMARPVDYLWVVRTSLTSRAAIDSVVARAHVLGVAGLLVQVVGRGDAYYESDVLPRAEALDGQDFDPLGEIVSRAHLAGLEVHAWMNTLLVWSAPQPPKDPRHIVRAHPEWIAVLEDGRPMSRLTAKERERLGVEGVFLAPAHPGVRAWVASIAREIADRYPVDGIHLDYIRYPNVAVGYDAMTQALFSLRDGLAPAQLRAVPTAVEARSDSEWNEFRTMQITEVVRAVRDKLKELHSDVLLSAAVVADLASAESIKAQAWRSWLDEGLVDRVFPMVYAAPVQTVMDQLADFAREFGTTSRLVPGIAIFNTSPSRAVLKILGARELGYPLVALYSYDSLFTQRTRWTSFRDQLERASAGH